MSKKFRLLMGLVLVMGLFGGMMTASTVSADPVAGVRFQVPRIDLGDPFGTGISDWDTKIQIQNLGPATTVTATFYGPYKGTGASPLLGAQSMWLPVNGVWTLHTVIKLNFPTAEAAIITTANPAVDLLAVTVDRWGTDAFGEFQISSSYTAVEDAMHGDNRYFVPYVMYDYHDLDTTLAIQNSGEYTVSVWIYYKQEGNCEYQCAQHIESLSPGEAVRVGPGVDADFPFPTCVTPGWLGSVYISAAQPLGIVVDQLSLPNPGANRAVLSSYRGMPYKPILYGEWGTEWYADLLYREISGWDASIQVQNLTQTSLPTFVTVDFMDQSGDEILFVGDWICRNGAETFYLPAIIDLGVNYPFGYVGAAEIASHQQVDYPGEHHDEGEPIFAVVDLKKRKMWDPDLGEWRYTNAGENQAGAYNAHPKEEKEWAWYWYMPFIAKEGNGVTSRIALRNNGNCNKIQGKIWIMDETGVPVGVIHTPWLEPKHLKIIDLAYQGWLTPGFVGAAYFEVLGVEQLCDTDNDGRVDNEAIMPSIVVLNYGWEAEIERPQPLTTAGDLTRVYEAIPVQGEEKFCWIDICGQVIEALDLKPINGADISTVVFDEGPFSLSGYAYVDPEGGGDLVCGQTSAIRVAGATVELQVQGTAGWSVAASTTTSSAGEYSFANKLTLGKTYRVKILINTGGGNTVSFVSGTFVAGGVGTDPAGWTGDGTMDFIIDASGFGLDPNEGAWCPADWADRVETATKQADADSTGHFCFAYEKLGAEDDIWLKAEDAAHEDLYVHKTGLTCDDDLWVEFEMYPLCDTIAVDGYVYDKMTGEPIQGATVIAWNDMGFDMATTSATGYYFLELAFDPGDATKVVAGAEGYTPHEESMYIPKCGYAYQTFELHQTPKSRVLLYYGNGGVGPATEAGPLTDYYTLKALYEAMGFIVDYTGVWPTAFDWTLKYKLIVLLGPGHASGDNVAVDGFTLGQKADLDRYLEQGGVLVVLTDHSGFTGQAVENDLLNALPVELQFNSNSWANGLGNQIVDPVGCQTNNVAVFDTDQWTDIAPGANAYPGALILQNGSANPATNCPNCVMYASDYPSHGNGEVKVVGDMNFVDDFRLLSDFNWPADNEAIPLNWIICDP